MTQVEGFDDKVQFIWSIAEILRGDIRQHEYGQFILPFVVLRRLDCVLEPTKQQVIDKAVTLEGKVSNVGPLLERAAKAPFYNVSPLTFTALVNDDKNVRANLLSYIAGFSSGAAEVLEKYRFAERVNTLDNAGLLYQVVARFADVDLHPDAVPNHAMGYIFEELLRRFSEMQNETAGEHFTPREVIELMVNLLLAEDADALSGTAPVRTMYDPACGTGGMLATAQTHLRAMNKQAQLQMFGQELNPETWAVCRSDMLIKSVGAADVNDLFASGSNPENIAFGNSLTADGHAGRHFDYMLANPPFGVDWKKYSAPLIAEAENDGWDGRFGAGLPRTSDGSFLFLQHMINKMKPVNADGSGGTRLAIVFSGSPLFSGGAGSGESNIRKWIIESDWLEAVVALPDQLFYNTGINTYFWILTNRKTPERKGKVALIDARGDGTKMRRSLGNKRYYFTEETVASLTRLYSDAPTLNGADARVKMLRNEEFGYQRITVEQPMRRRWTLTSETVAALQESKAWHKWAALAEQPGVVLDALSVLVDVNFTTEDECRRAIKRAATELPASVVKEVLRQAAVADPNAPIATDRDGSPLPDPDLRDFENIPLGENATSYIEREVHPFTPEAWADESKTKIGYEIPFGRHFHVFIPPRPVADLDAEIAEREARIAQLLGGLG